MADPATPVTWSVTRQQPTSQNDPRTGQPTRGVEVFFTTGTGHPGQVFISNADFTADRAFQIVADHAAKVEAVGNMTSTTPPG